MKNFKEQAVEIATELNKEFSLKKTSLGLELQVKLIEEGLKAPIVDFSFLKKGDEICILETGFTFYIVKSGKKPTGVGIVCADDSYRPLLENMDYPINLESSYIYITSEMKEINSLINQSKKEGGYYEKSNTNI